MSVAIYIAIAFATASLVLSIVAFAVVINFMDNPFKSNKRVDSLESKLAETDGRIEGLAEAINRKSAMMNNRIDDVEHKLARTVGWIEGLTGKTIKGVEVGVE